MDADLDDADRAVLRALLADARASYVDLGRATGLSTSAVHQRVRRLERRGVIRGYAAVVDPAALGLPLTAFVAVSPFDAAAPDDVPDRLSDVHEIEACYSVAGEANYLLQVRVDSPASLEDLLALIRTRAQVSTRTTIVLSTPYEHRPPSL